jgi:hypothetical protein
MEINEAIDPLQPESSNELILTQTAQFYLTQISKWTKFLSILGFIGCGLMVLLGLAFSTMIGTFTTYQNNKAVSELFVSPWVFFYILIAIFYFFASLYLYQFGEKVKTGIVFQDPLQVESGFSKLKSLFKMIGITTIVFITIYVVAIVIFMLIKPQSINYGV